MVRNLVSQGRPATLRIRTLHIPLYILTFDLENNRLEFPLNVLVQLY